MKFSEFYTKALEAFPKATVSEDEDGQLIIHTNMMIDGPFEASQADELVVDMDEHIV
tara:strand:+ start:409 stop:579 length:171 start_codon:yes stop_codon:yes gene_type:complete